MTKDKEGENGFLNLLLVLCVPVLHLFHLVQMLMSLHSQKHFDDSAFTNAHWQEETCFGSN